MIPVDIAQAIPLMERCMVDDYYYQIGEIIVINEI
jgi:hypothetical protein